MAYQTFEQVYSSLYSPAARKKKKQREQAYEATRQEMRRTGMSREQRSQVYQARAQARAAGFEPNDPGGGGLAQLGQAGAPTAGEAELQKFLKDTGSAIDPETQMIKVRKDLKSYAAKQLDISADQFEKLVNYKYGRFAEQRETYLGKIGIPETPEFIAGKKAPYDPSKPDQRLQHAKTTLFNQVARNIQSATSPEQKEAIARAVFGTGGPGSQQLVKEYGDFVKQAETADVRQGKPGESRNVLQRLKDRIESEIAEKVPQPAQSAFGNIMAGLSAPVEATATALGVALGSKDITGKRLTAADISKALERVPYGVAQAATFGEAEAIARFAGQKNLAERLKTPEDRGIGFRQISTTAEETAGREILRGLGIGGLVDITKELAESKHPKVRALSHLTGFVGDIAIDPLTYATLGSGRLGKAALDVAGDAAERAVFQKAVGVAGRETAYKTGTKRGVTLGDLARDAAKAGVDRDTIEAAVQKASQVRLAAKDAYGVRGIKGLREVVDAELGKGATSKLFPRVSAGRGAYLSDVRGGVGFRVGVGPAKLAVSLKEGSPYLRQALRAIQYGPERTMRRSEAGVALGRVGRGYDKFYQRFAPESIVREGQAGYEAALSRETRKWRPGLARELYDLQTAGEGVRRQIADPALEKWKLGEEVLDRAFSKSDAKRGSKIIELLEEGPNSRHYKEAAAKLGPKKIDEAVKRMGEALDEARAGAEARGVRVPMLEELAQMTDAERAEAFRYFPHEGQLRQLANEAGIALPQVVRSARQRVLKKGAYVQAPSGKGGVLPSGRFRDVQEITEGMLGKGMLVANPFHQGRAYIGGLAHAAKNVDLYERAGMRGFAPDVPEDIVKELGGAAVADPDEVMAMLARSRADIMAQGGEAIRAGQEAADVIQFAEAQLARNTQDLADGHQLLQDLGEEATRTAGYVKTVTRSVQEKRELTNLAKQEYAVKKRTLEAEFRQARAAAIAQAKVDIREARADQSSLVSLTKKLDKTHRKNLETLEKTYRQQLDGLAISPQQAEAAVLKELHSLGQVMRQKKAGLETADGRSIAELQADINEAQLRRAQIQASKLNPAEYNVVAKTTRALNQFDAYNQAKAQRDAIAQEVQGLRAEQRELITERNRLAGQRGLKQNTGRAQANAEAVANLTQQIDDLEAQIMEGAIQAEDLATLADNPPDYFARHQQIVDSLTQEELATPLGALLTDFKGREALERVAQQARERTAATNAVRARVRRAEERAVRRLEPVEAEPVLPLPDEFEIAGTLGPQASRAARELRGESLEGRLRSPADELAAQRHISTRVAELRDELPDLEEGVRLARAAEREAPSRRTREARITAEAEFERAKSNLGGFEREAERLAQEVYRRTILLPMQRATHVLDADTAARRTAVTQARNEELARTAARRESIQTRTAWETNKRLNRARAQGLADLIDDTTTEMQALLGAQPERQRMAFLNNVLADLHPNTTDEWAGSLSAYMEANKGEAGRLLTEWGRIVGGVEDGYRQAIRDFDTAHLDAMIAENDAAKQLQAAQGMDVAAEAEGAALASAQGRDLNYFLDDLSHDEALLEAVRTDHAQLRRAYNAQSLAVAQLRKQNTELDKALSEAQAAAEGAHNEFFDAMDRSLRHGLAEAMAPNLAELEWVALNLPYVKGAKAMPAEVAAVIKNASDPGAMENWGNLVSQFNSMWKRGTLLSFGSTNRRILGNLYTAAVYEGVTPFELRKAWRTLAAFRQAKGDASKIKDPKLQRYMRFGVDQNMREGKWASQIASRPEEFKRGIRHPLQTLEGWNFAWANNAEDLIRMAAFIKAIDRGMGPSAARSFVGKYHFFNHELTPFERKYMRNLVPFYAYMKNNTALQIYNLLHRPGRLSNIASLQQNFAAVEEDPFAPSAATRTGGFALPLFRTRTPEKGRGPLRDTLSQLFPYTTDPTAGDQEFLYNTILDTSVLALPSQTARAIPDALRGDLAGNELLGNITPGLKSPVEFLTGQNLYSGLPFSQRGESFLGVPLDARIKGTLTNLFPVTRHIERFFPGSDNEIGQEQYAEGLMGELLAPTIRASTVSSQAAEAGRRSREAVDINAAIKKVLAKDEKKLLETEQLGPYEKSERLQEALAAITQGKNIGNLLGAAKTQKELEAAEKLPGGLGTVGGPAVQIALRAQQAGFEGEDLVTAVAVALAESNGDPGARALNASEDSRGLWQINTYAHPELAQGGDLYDPDYNAQAAMAVLGKQGWSAWSVYKSGKYQDYMAEAQAAVAELMGGGGGGGVPASFKKDYSRNNLSPGTNYALNILQNTYPNVEIGGYATSGHAANSDHYTGQALDFMSRDDVEAGYDSALYFLNNAEQLGVKYIIWQGQIWSAARANEGWRPYHGSSPHTDHVHISFYS